MPRTSKAQKAFLERTKLFKAHVVTEETIKALGDAPVDSAGNVVLLSVCDGASRAEVYSGTGKTLSDAWDNAAPKAMKGIKGDLAEPKWIRADVVSEAWPATALDVLNEIKDTPSGFDFNGLAFDPKFETAIVDGEMNGRGLYDYSDDKVNMTRLNNWMEEKGKKALSILPDDMTGFKCWGWFCDEDNAVYPLYREGADTGRRQLSGIDADYARDIINAASSYLVNQVRPDGTFNYNILPQYDRDSDDYNILRHSGTIWSLICRYRMFHDEWR